MRLHSQEASSVQEVSCRRRMWARPWPLGEGFPEGGNKGACAPGCSWQARRIGTRWKRVGDGGGGMSRLGFGSHGPWPRVIPGPSYWAPARSKEWAPPFCRASLLRGCAAGAAVAWHLCGCHGNDGGANLLMSPPRLQITILERLIGPSWRVPCGRWG